MSIKDLADQLAAKGRYGDTELVHMTKGEVAGLQGLAEAAGGSLTINPDTGKPEAFFLAALLPTLLGGVGASMGLGALGTAALGAGVGALTNKRNPLMGAIMGGFGGMGGGQLANALGAAGTAGTAMGSAIPGQAAANLATTEAAKQAVAAGATGQGSQAAMLAAQNMGAPTAQLATTTLAPNSFAAAGQGIAGLGTQAGRAAAMQSLGGASGALKTAGMAAAPAMYGYMTQPPEMPEEDDTELPRYDYTAGLTGDYYGMGGDGSTRERQFFTQPTFTRRMAEGGETDPKDPARGMTGASAEAMRYLMGQSNASPATVAAQQAIQQMAAAQAAPAAPVAPAQPQGISKMDLMRNPLMLFGGNLEGADGGGSGRRTDGGSGAMLGMFGDLFDQDKDKTPRFSYDPMTQRYTRMAMGGQVYAEGGLAQLARGGMKAGGFVVPADVVSMVGEGNTEAGYERIKRMLPGATPIKGKDGGQADTVATSIEGKQPAAVAHGEMYIPPAAVKRAGGAKKLYAMMNNVRKQATGSKKQIRPVDLRKAMA
jgi:hypothetical protein